MREREALEYLAENLSGYEQIPTDESDSMLISLASSSKVVSLEDFQPAPNRIKQSASLFSCQSFCDYVNRFKLDGTSVYLNVDARKFAAVIDHHNPDKPSWGSHRATFAPKVSLEWNAWTRIHKQPLNQVELAQFIEEMLDSIVDPEPNTMLKAALDFQSNESLVLGSTTNLDDGSTKFNFTKDNVNKSVTFPHRIKIAIPLHENEIRETLEGRIRYRTNSEGVLTFVFSFVRDPRAIQRDALIMLADKIRADTKGLAQYEGAL